MAMQLDLTQSQFGVPFAGAYYRIVTAAITRQRGGERSVMLDVVGYAAVPQDYDTREVDFRRYHSAWLEVEAQAGADFIAKCYAWLATQDDMAGAVGV